VDNIIASRHGHCTHVSVVRHLLHRVDSDLAHDRHSPGGAHNLQLAKREEGQADALLTAGGLKERELFLAKE
jgi:hypothetical protein